MISDLSPCAYCREHVKDKACCGTQYGLIEVKANYGKHFTALISSMRMNILSAQATDTLLRTLYTVVRGRMIYVYRPTTSNYQSTFLEYVPEEWDDRIRRISGGPDESSVG